MVKLTLKAARVNAGLTQKAAAEKLRVSNKTLGQWENGITSPNIKKLEALCDLYGVNYDNLIFFTT